MPFTYIDRGYMMRKYDARVIVQLTNDDSRVDPHDPANANDAVMMDAENDAAQTVDNYLRDLYAIPLEGATLTAEIKSIVAALTWCNLWERRGEESDQITNLRKRMFERLESMAKPQALETRGPKTSQAIAVRSTRGRERTMFDDSGYFDGLSKIQGRRRLAADRETGGAESSGI